MQWEREGKAGKAAWVWVGWAEALCRVQRKTEPSRGAEPHPQRTPERPVQPLLALAVPKAQEALCSVFNYSQHGAQCLSLSGNRKEVKLKQMCLAQVWGQGAAEDREESHDDETFSGRCLMLLSKAIYLARKNSPWTAKVLVCLFCIFWKD